MEVTSKQQLRTRMKAKRDSLLTGDVHDWSARICNSLLNLEEVRCARSVFVYVSCRSEVRTHSLVQRWLESDKIVTVPRTAGGAVMTAHRIDRWSQLTAGDFNILEPHETEPYSGPLDICIAPGLAFTLAGDRLGYGRGHYDRFLAAHPALPVFGLAFEAQIVDCIPAESTDRRMNWIVTERRVIQCK